MPSALAKFVAVRPRMVNFQQGRRSGTSKMSYQIAVIPLADPHGFPAVLTLGDEDMFNACQQFSAGDKIKFSYVETVLDERVVSFVEPVAN